MITRTEAISIARKAIEGKIKPQEGSPVEVETKNSCFVVTFVTVLAPGTRGPDFSARVTIDAASGKIIEVLAGAD